MATTAEQALAALRRDGLASVAGKGGRYIRGRREARRARAAWRAAAQSVASVDDALDLAFGFSYGEISVAPFQFRSEIRTLIERVQQLTPRTVLQIGTCTGGTLYLLTRFSAPDALVVSVDLPHGPFGGGYPPWLDRMFESFARGQQRVRLILGDSHEHATSARIGDALAGRALDFLFIDGDHSYEGVRSDFELYSPLVRPGGVIAFHDIVPGPPENVGGVPRFWSELKERTQHAEEIVESWTQGSAGIGLVTVDG